MPIDTFGFPMPQAFSGGADFTPLANLGNVYQQGQAQQRQLAALAQMGNDPTQNAMMLIKSGDPQMAQHGIDLMNTIQQQNRLNAQQQQQTWYQQQEVAAAQERNKLAREEFEAKGPEDPEDRETLWKKRHPDGDINSPQAQAYIWKQPQLLRQDPELAKKGLTPYFGVRTNPQTGQEETVPMQIGQTGFTEAQVPPGITFRNKPIVVPGPTMDTLLDPITRQVIGTVPKDIAGAERQKVIGEAEGKAITNLPTIEASTSMELNTIDKLLKHPGLDISVGRSGLAYGKLDPVLQPDRYRNFMALYNQLQSQAFLQVYDQMRGAGAISNYEDQKGTAAKMGMQQAQTKEEFISAANDYRKVIEAGVEKARKMTTIGSPQTGAPVSSGGTTTTTAPSSGVPEELKAEMRKRGIPIPGEGPVAAAGPAAAGPPAAPISR